MTVAQRPTVVRRDYTPEQREKILEDAAKLAVCEAARKHGVPQPTISGWRRGRGAGGSGGEVPSRAGFSSNAGVLYEKNKPAAAQTSAAKPVTRKRVAKRYTPSQKAQALELAAAVGVSEAARQLDVSRFALRQ